MSSFLDALRVIWSIMDNAKKIKQVKVQKIKKYEVILDQKISENFALLLGNVPQISHHSAMFKSRPAPLGIRFSLVGTMSYMCYNGINVVGLLSFFLIEYILVKWNSWWEELLLSGAVLFLAY